MPARVCVDLLSLFVCGGGWLASVLVHLLIICTHLVCLDSPGSSPGGQLVPLPALWRPCFPLILVQLFLWFRRDWFTCIHESVIFSLNLSPCIMDSRVFWIPSRNHLVVTLDPAETDRNRQAFGNNGNPPEPLRLSWSRFLRTSFVSSLLWRLLRSACSLFRNTSTWTLPWAPYSQTSKTLWKAGNMWGRSPLPPPRQPRLRLLISHLMQLGNVWLTSAERRRAWSPLQPKRGGGLTGRRSWAEHLPLLLCTRFSSEVL